MNTIYKAFLVILGQKGGLQVAVNEDDTTVTGVHTIRIEKSFTEKALRTATEKGHTRIAKDLRESMDAVGEEFYRVTVDEDTTTTDVPTQIGKNRLRWGIEFLEAALERRGQDLVKLANARPPIPELTQREEAGPVTRIPANADSVEAILREAKEDLDKGEITRAEWYTLRASLTK